VSYANLAEGWHTFQVQATDQAGNVDPFPAERSWTIDVTPPQTTINSGPSGTSQSNVATFAYSSSEGTSTFQCAVDAGSFEPCPSAAKMYDDLKNGSHAFRVRATDVAGNTDGTPATRGWSIDMPSQRCDDGIPVQDGSVGDAYVKVRTKVRDQGADVCYSFEGEDATRLVGGVFSVRSVGSPGTPTSDQNARSCETASGNLVPPPHPTREGQLGDPNDPLQLPPYTPYRLDAYANAAQVWICMQVDDTQLRVIVPSQPSVVTHQSDP
jgi:hypothetical protein